MAISIKKYVDITSGVGGGSSVAERELILRIMTTSSTIPTGVVVEMTELDEVAEQFGTQSEEYRRAAKYFGFVSKVMSKPGKISFARFSNGSSTPPSISGSDVNETDLEVWKLVTDGSVDMSVGDLPVYAHGMDFSTAESLADVCTIIQEKLAIIVPGVKVTYVTGNQRFNVSFNGINPPSEVKVNTSTVGDDLSSMLGWIDGLLSPGSVSTTALNALIEADGISDNYGSFLFTGTQEFDIQKAIAEWNAAQDLKYMYLLPVPVGQFTKYHDTFSTISGVALTLVSPVNVEFDEQIPGTILAATNYNLRNAGQNYMFQQFDGLTPKVSDDTTVTAIDKTRVNYYGRTKNAGQPIDFYQNGYMCGNAKSPQQMNVYANEQWLKAHLTAKLLNALIALPIIPAAEEGRTIVLGVLQEAIDNAKYNGTIKAEKDLNATQKAYVLQVTGDPLAWQQIQSIGYWVDATVNEKVEGGVTKYYIDYTLLYSKADAVNKITGRDILI